MASYQGPGVSNPIYDVSQSVVVDVVNENEDEPPPQERLRTESTGSMLCILSVKSDAENNTVQDDDTHDAVLIDDHRRPTKDDAIIDLNIDSKALHFVSVFLLITLQRIPRHYSSRTRTVLTALQCLVVVGMILAYAYDMGAFPNTNTITINHWDNTVTTTKNLISNVKFTLLYVVGICYFRTRHLESMLSDVKLTKRYWKYGRKRVMFLTAMVFFFCAFIPAICNTIQMSITTQANPDEYYVWYTIILNCLLSLVVRTMSLSIVFAFILVVYLIYCRIRLFKAQIQKWPASCKNYARNTYVDICRQIRNSERNFQPFLIVHITILLMLLIPTTISFVEQFEAQGSYTKSVSLSPSVGYNKPIKIDPQAEQDVLIVDNQTSLTQPHRDWRNHPGQLIQVSNGNKTKKSPMDEFNEKLKTHDERYADVLGIIKVIVMVLEELLEIVWLYVLPIILIGKVDKCINSIRDAVKLLKFEEQRRESYMFQTPEDMNTWIDIELKDVRGIQLMGFNLASFKAAVLTLLLPFLTTMFRLMLRHVDISP